MNWIDFSDNTLAKSEVVIDLEGIDTTYQSLGFNGLCPVPDRGIPPDIETAFVRLSSRLRDTAEQIQWIQALRHVPPRTEIARYTGPEIAPDGTGITQLLAAEEMRGSEVMDDISRWYQDATGYRIAIERGVFRQDDLFSIVVTPPGSSASIALADTGEGLGQVLPVVGLLSMAKAQLLRQHPLIAVEHPELHLHPAAHSDLAALFCDVARHRNATTFVETHSENFLLRVQLEIARGQLDPSLVRLYWVRQTDDGEAIAEAIDFDDLGRPVGDNWPPGLFSEHVTQAREIALERRRRTRY